MTFTNTAMLYLKSGLFHAGVVPLTYSAFLEDRRVGTTARAAIRLALYGRQNQLNSVESAFLDFALANAHRGWSQFSQDKFVLFCLGEQRDGLFVEFGGADGLTHSNSALLESDYGWRGILVEPNPFEFRLLKRNRPLAKAFNAAIKHSDQEFIELVICGQLSTAEDYAQSDFHAKTRARSSVRRKVRCIDLNETLNNAGYADRVVDYISMDTEGSELDILKRFSFDHGPRVLTIETNERAEEEANLRNLLQSKGYREVLPSSMTAPDRWFVREDVYEKLPR